MSDSNTNETEREDIEALLPWYEQGRLDARDAKRVEEYLAAHPEMEHQISLIAEERGETVLLNEARGAPGAGALDRLMEGIEADEAANPSLASVKPALKGWMSKLFGTPVPAGLQWASAAAAVVIVAQGVALGVLTTSEVSQGPAYETASSPAQKATAGTYAVVQFAQDATAAQINGLLTEMGLSIVDGPKPGGMYRVRLSGKALENSKRDTILKQLLSHEGLVELAVPAE
ncbi:MAG: hypothetical protein MPJ78_10360 [Hyphomicrobiaceae bacterium]|nr:hypothetical protein [Hyphomicrobiaceae bacterium]